MSKEFKSENSKTDSRSYFFDFLRNLAIIFIIILHCGLSQKDKMKGGFVFWIEQAVPIFIIVLGYVNSLSFFKKNIDSIKRAYHPKLFFSRLIRFIIPYLMIFLIEEIVIMSLNKSWDDRFFLNLICGGMGPGSYWIPVILQISVIFPLLFLLTKKLKCSSIFISLSINILFEMLCWIFKMPTDVYRLLCFRYIFLIGCGIWLYFNIKSKYKWYLAVPSFIIGLTSLILKNYLNINFVIVNDVWFSTSYFGALYLFPIISLTSRYIKMSKQKIWTYISNATFNIFLVQMVYFFFHNYYDYFGNPMANVWIDIIVCLTLGFVFRWLESKFTKWICTKINTSVKGKNKN